MLRRSPVSLIAYEGLKRVCYNKNNLTKKGVVKMVVDLIRQNIENAVSEIGKKLEQTKMWVDRMEAQAFDVSALKAKQARQEARLEQLRGLL